MSDLTNRARALLDDISQPTAGLSDLVMWQHNRMAELMALVPDLLTALDQVVPRWLEQAKMTPDLARMLSLLAADGPLEVPADDVLVFYAAVRKALL